MKHFTDNHVVTYCAVTHVLMNLNASIRMMGEGYFVEGIDALKAAIQQLQDERDKMLTSTEVTEGYVEYLRYIEKEWTKEKLEKMTKK